MARKLPVHVLAELKETVRRLADAHRYLERSQIENTAFIDTLARHPEVGVRIGEFMGAHEVRHYIKDAILKKYAKAKRQPPKDVSRFVENLYLKRTHLIETAEGEIVSLYRCDDGQCIVAAKVAFRKWETGLRRALLYIARNKTLHRQPRRNVQIVLLLLLHGRPITDADKQVAERAFGLIGVSFCWIE